MTERKQHILTEGKHIHHVGFELVTIEGDIAGVFKANDQLAELPIRFKRLDHHNYLFLLSIYSVCS